MKLLRVASLVALALFGSWQAADAGTKDPAKFNVRMVGHPPYAAGELTDNIMEFSMPVEVPHAILPAGSYLFHFLSPTVVQVMDLKQSVVYATFAAVPARRVLPATSEKGRRGVARLQTVGPDQPLRLVSWYLTGRSSGSAPVYKKAHQAVLVAETITSSD